MNFKSRKAYLKFIFSWNKAEIDLENTLEWKGLKTFP